MTAGMDLDPLFEPIEFGSLRVVSRFVMALMTRNRCPGGVPGADVAACYRRRAEGGVGFIITEGTGIPHPSAIGFSGVEVMDIPDMYGDSALAGWRHVAEEVHRAGGKIAPQLWHQGVMRLAGTGTHPQAKSMRPSGHWGPTDRYSVVPADYVERVATKTRPMTESEMADVIPAYAVAAANAKARGNARRSASDAGFGILR